MSAADKKETNSSPAKKAVAKTDISKKRPNRFKNFFRGVWNELKKVHWPTRQQLINHTGVVVISVLVMAIIISIFDLGISTLIEALLSLV